MKVVFKIFFLFFITYTLTPLLGNDENTVAIGDSLFEIGELKEAEENYKSALKRDKKNISARFGLGKIKIEKEEWANANDEFEKILKIDPQNKTAHYYRGICYRENGKFKVLLQRKWEWNRSKKHFLAVMKQDSTFRDVLLQYAILLQYRHKFDDAIRAAQRQILVRPDLVEPQIRIFRIYQYFIFQDVDRDLINLENTLSSGEIIEWLEKQPYDHARFAIAEKYRSMGEYKPAATVLNDMLQTPLIMPRQAIYLSLARIHYAQLQAEKAESYFWRAVDEMDDDVDAGIVFQDVKYIQTDHEYAEYQTCSTIEEKKAFFRHLWTKRDPTPIAAINYRLSEHYHRLLYAEKNYIYRGFRSRFSQVDRMSYIHYPASYKLNEEFNDKGLIYIRHGKPDEQVVNQGEDVPVESWMYYETATAPKMIFHFTPERESQYWRFTPIIENQQMIQERSHWGRLYHKFLYADETQRLAYVDEMAHESEEAVSSALVTDRHSWEVKLEPLPVSLTTASFRGANGRTNLEIYYSIAMSPIQSKMKQERSLVKIDKGLVIYDDQWNLAGKNTDTIELDVQPGNRYVDYYLAALPPDSFHIVFNASCRTPALLNTSRYRVQVKDFSSDDLNMSDILFASEIKPSLEKGKFTRQDLDVVPNPSHIYLKTQPVYMYFELYNLTRNDEQRTNFLIEYTLTLVKSRKSGLSKLFGFLTGGKSAITLETDREGASEFSAEYLAINVEKNDPGDYELLVTVTDKNTGDVVKRKRYLSLY